MTSILTLRRAFIINRTLIRHGLEEFLTPTPLSRLTGLMKLFALTNNRSKQLDRGERLNRALTELGPIFIKLGQMLSTRRDLLPDDIADHLTKLQDKVEPFDSAIALKIVEQQLGQKVEQIFDSFDHTPLASASVAQVHSATLRSGEEVVVKVIRPGIKKKIVADLKLLKLLAHWFEKYSATGRRLHAKTIIQDYQNTLFNELDLRIEAANTSQLRRNFEGNSVLYVPQVYWDMCKKRVMVQEKIHGIAIGDIEKLKSAGVDMQLLAHRGVEIFFTQVFKHSYFHADMHPGNIFVDATDPSDPKYIGIDCGIMGTLNESDKRYLAQNFVAFFNRDYRRIAELHLECGWVPANVSAEEFESAIRTACEPIFGKPLDEISFGHFLVQLFQTARRFEMEVQPQLVLLQKTLLYIEGLGRQLYPKLDLWQTAQPFLNDWLKQTYGPQAILQKLKDKAPVWLEQLPEMPDKISQFLEQSDNRSKAHSELVDELIKLNQSQRRSSTKISLALAGTSAALVGLLLPAEFAQYNLLQAGLIGLSLFMFVLSFRH
ncbi:MAG: ubiquinone biosynthesis regulatory protein kinase UbiB [Kangiellaceae bacterium]|nr:ubiquinone biosynthesis regulatory protein kinase UbiB [Kangiellaceae bacterium]MCW8998632.1 ubiquinone biosynthesis regulatory protein kinase UbiB [Kangiellaceae bacterium]